jgi:predicted phosphatase
MSKLPRFDSIDELARFWDTHDLTDYEDELEEVEEPVFKAKAGTVVKIRLLPKQAAALRRRAKSAGVPQADLVSEWITEKLRSEEKEKVKG